MTNPFFKMFPLEDDFQMASLVAVGLPISAIQRVGAALGLAPRKVGALVSINEKTLERRLQAKTKLKPLESERVARLMRIIELTIRVLENETNAREWLNQPLKILGGQTPLEMAATEPGAREVEHALGRLEHGVFA